MKIILKVQR